MLVLNEFLEDIQKKFPWYLRMAALVGGSPKYSRKAVSNSQSVLDLTVLATESPDDEVSWCLVVCSFCLRATS